MRAPTTSSAAIATSRRGSPSSTSLGLAAEEIDAQHPTVEAEGDFAPFLAYEARFSGR